MTERDTDSDLAERFEALRANEGPQAPPFDAAWRSARIAASSLAPRASTTAERWAALAATAALIAAAFFFLAPRPRIASTEATIAKAREISSWSAPTDPFLDLASLDTSSVSAARGASRSMR